MAAAFAKLKKK